MKKYKIFFLSLFVILCMLMEASISSAACFMYTDPYGPDTIYLQHTHKYTAKTIKPTCTSIGFDIFSCWCEKTMFGNVVPALPHEETSTVVSPTCVNSGYTNYICKVCNNTERRDIIAAFGHNIGDWETITNPTIWSDGVRQKKCLACDYSETENIPKITGGIVKLVDKSKTMSNIINEPSSDFGQYYSQAYAMYTCIKNGNVGSYGNWPSGIYGPSGYAHFTLAIDGINEMSSAEQQTIAYSTVRSFATRFNSQVLNNSIHLSMNMWDVVPGGVSIHINPAAAKSKLEAQVSNDVFYETCVNKIGLYNGMSQIDAIYAINNWMCDNISYSSGSDAFEVLRTGQAQCAGYASLFKQLCASASIECYYISGCYHGDPSHIPCHAWNKVILNGSAYWVDVCWNDTGSNRNAYLLSQSLWETRIVA